MDEVRCGARLMIGNCAAYVHCEDLSGDSHVHSGILTGSKQRYVSKTGRSWPEDTQTLVPRAEVKWGYGLPIYTEGAE